MRQLVKARRFVKLGVLVTGTIGLCLAVAGCSSGSSPSGASMPSRPSGTPPSAAMTSPRTPSASEPRPSGLPAAAIRASSNAQYGEVSAPSGADPRVTQLFYSLSCRDGLLAIVTNMNATYAELPCDRSLPQAAIQPFLGKPVQIRVVAASPGKLYLDSSAAGSVEFTVGRVWLLTAR